MSTNAQPAYIHKIHIDGVRPLNSNFISNHVVRLFDANSLSEMNLMKQEVVESLLNSSNVVESVSINFQSVNGDYEAVVDIKELKQPQPYLKTVIKNETDLSLGLGLLHGNTFGSGENFMLEYQMGVTGPGSSKLRFSKPSPNNSSITWGIGAERNERWHRNADYRVIDDSVFGDLTIKTWAGQHTIICESIRRYLSTMGKYGSSSLRSQQGVQDHLIFRHIFENDSRDCCLLPKSGHLLRINEALCNSPRNGHILLQGEYHRWSAIPGFQSAVLQQSFSAGKIFTDRMENVCVADRFLHNGLGFARDGLRCISDDGIKGGLAFCQALFKIFFELPKSFQSVMPNSLAQYSRIQAGLFLGNAFDNFSKPQDSESPKVRFVSAMHSMRVGTGFGIVIRVPNQFKLELSYELPLKYLPTDLNHSGLRFGISTQ